VEVLLLIYEIISGPVTVAGQNSNVFNSLAPGIYNVLVTDNCNNTSIENVKLAIKFRLP
jgi:hypothetical protein